MCKKAFIYILEPICNTLSIQSSGKSAYRNETKYDHVYGNYTFQMWDGNGFSVYGADIQGDVQYLSRSANDPEVWLVSTFIFRKYQRLLN